MRRAGARRRTRGASARSPRLLPSAIATGTIGQSPSQRVAMTDAAPCGGVGATAEQILTSGDGLLEEALVLEHLAEHHAQHAAVPGVADLLDTIASTSRRRQLVPRASSRINWPARSFDLEPAMTGSDARRCGYPAEILDRRRSHARCVSSPVDDVLVGVVEVRLPTWCATALCRSDERERARRRTPGARQGVRSASRLLLFLAGDAHPRPRDGVQPGLGNRLAAVAADAVGALLDAQRALPRSPAGSSRRSASA